MKKSEFEKIMEESSFDKAMEQLYEENNSVTTYESLKDFIIKCINKDNDWLALFVLYTVYYSEGDSEWYYYDYCAGSTCTPQQLNNIDDVEQYIGFDEED